MTRAFSLIGFQGIDDAPRQPAGHASPPRWPACWRQRARAAFPPAAPVAAALYQCTAWTK